MCVGVSVYQIVGRAASLDGQRGQGPSRFGLAETSECGLECEADHANHLPARPGARDQRLIERSHTR